MMMLMNSDNDELMTPGDVDDNDDDDDDDF